jgi:hypothetical protein
VTAKGPKAVAGFPWKKPKPLASSLGIRFRRTDVVALGDQPHVTMGVGGAGALGHVAEDDDDLRLEVEAPRRVGKDEIVGGSEENARAALVHQGIALQRGRGLGAAGLAPGGRG